MEILHFSEMLSEQNKRKIKNLLQQDGIIVYPTDTLYGIGGNFFSPAVMEKIDNLKGRSNMPYSAAVADTGMIKKYLAGRLPGYFDQLAKDILPGKCTLLVEASLSIEKKLLKNSSKIGVRIPGCPALLELISYLQMPLVTTSVNRSGSPPLQDPGEIKQQFPGIDLLIDAGVLPASKGSTIIDITVSPFKIIRQGDDFDKIISLKY